MRPLAIFMALAAGPLWAAEVSVTDPGPQFHPSTFECAPGHSIQNHELHFQGGAVHYAFRYTGCMDPSHGDEHPAAEGNFGMPVPTLCNWYWGGFFNLTINGQDAVRFTVSDMRALDSGERGSGQIIWQHPDAEVGLRLAMLPGSNHVLALLVWRPRPGKQVDGITVRLTCYPSFFTAARNRQGERHCLTPRTDEQEPKALELVPAQDTWLLYYDQVFDLAKGEGEGPCAALVSPENIKAGRVHIGGYAVSTELDLRPEAGEARLAFYDFVGQTNAEAEAYMRRSGAQDLAELAALDFRPSVTREPRADTLRAEATQLLAAAADDALALRPRVEDLLARLTDLREKATGGDWAAEADLAETVRGSEDLMWKLRIFALLNKP